MAHSAKSVKNQGFLQWNAGGWFGGTIGSCAWMLPLSGYLFIFNQPWLGSFSLSVFIILTTVSLSLWINRHRVSSFHAHMVLLGLLSIFIPVILIIVSMFGSPEVLIEMKWPVNKSTILVASFMAPVLMLWFFILNQWGPLRNSSSFINPEADV